MLEEANGRSVQGVVAQPPLLGKGLSKVDDSRLWCLHLPPQVALNAPANDTVSGLEIHANLVKGLGVLPV